MLIELAKVVGDWIEEYVIEQLDLIKCGRQFYTTANINTSTSTNTYTTTSTIDQTWQAGKMMGGNGNMACGDTREVKAPSNEL